MCSGRLVRVDTSIKYGEDLESSGEHSIFKIQSKDNCYVLNVVGETRAHL